MAELIVKEIINPFRKETPVNKIELDLFHKLINKKKVVYDNTDIAKDLFSQLMDIKDCNEDLRN